MKAFLAMIFFLSATIPIVFAEDTTNVNVNASASNFKVTYRENSCNSDEICIFSLSNLSNGHAGACENFTYQACATEIETAGVKNSCAADENQLVTLSELDGSGHVEAYFDPFAYRVCAKPSVAGFVCRYKTEPPPTDIYKCIISLSDQANAHVGDCTTNPFDFRIFCTIQSKTPQEHTIQARMEIKSDSGSVYIPGTGRKEFAEIEDKDYRPSSSYIASIDSLKNLMYGIVGASGNADLIGTSKTSDSYGLSLEQSQRSNIVYLVFTRAPLSNLQNRAEQLFKGAFIPAFGYSIEPVANILVGLSYGNSIVIDNKDTISPGRYSIVVRTLNETGSSEVIEIKTR